MEKAKCKHPQTIWTGWIAGRTNYAIKIRPTYGYKNTLWREAYVV